MQARLSISCFGYRFTPHWIACVFALLGMVFFSSLGVWQLHRAEEKRTLLAREASLSTRAPELWLGELKDIEPFKAIKFSGKFLPQVFFLDNQYHQHHIGYHVISPVLISTGHVVLVDRGWVPVGETRATLPIVNTPTEILNISGTVYQPKKKPWVLGTGLDARDTHHAVIEALDYALISQFLHKDVDPFIIRLNPDVSYGYVREWVTVVMPPERHLGYAFQWFSLALVVLIVFVALNMRKEKHAIKN